MKTIWKYAPWIISAVLYLLVGAAPFLAPYDPQQQFRQFPLQPPATIQFRDQEGERSWRPHFRLKASGFSPRHSEGTRMAAIDLWAESQPYSWLGLTWQARLFGSRDPSLPLLLLGSDRLGRDVLSRLLHGARFSFTIGLAAVLLSALAGVFLGALSGYLAGWADGLMMRITDVIFSLPPIFVVMGVRVLFPIELSPSRAYWLIALSFTLLGFTIFARVIRGQVLSLKTQDYALWAQACGASHWWVLRRHILPFTLNTVLVQGMVLLPTVVLGEVTLSFLGMGVQPPDPSLGNLIAEASTIPVMTGSPWMLWPAVVLLLAVFCFNLLADRIKGVEKSRRMW